MALKTIQVTVKGTTHDLQWDEEAKAYLSDSRIIKVTGDAKAKKVEVFVRKTVTDRWDKYTGRCDLASDTAGTCTIASRKYRQISVRFAPTARAAATMRLEAGFLERHFTEHFLTPDEIRSYVTDWVRVKIRIGELPGQEEVHIRRLLDLYDHSDIQLTRDRLRENMEAYLHTPAPVPAEKPLIRGPVGKSYPVISREAKSVKPPKVITDAQSSVKALDRSLEKVRKIAKMSSEKQTGVLYDNLRTLYREMDRRGESVWFAMQGVIARNNPADATLIEVMKKARNRYNFACRAIEELVIRKAAESVRQLESGKESLDTIAAKGPEGAAGLKRARRKFDAQFKLARAKLTAANAAMTLPGMSDAENKGRLVIFDIARKQNELAVIHAKGMKIKAAEKAAPLVPATPSGPAPAEVRTAQQALTDIQRKLDALPAPPADGSTPYNKAWMDKAFADGKLKTLYALAHQLTRAKELVESVQSTHKDAPGVAGLVSRLRFLARKLESAQLYVVTTHFDPNGEKIFEVYAKPPERGEDTPSHYEWLRDVTKRNVYSNRAKSVIRAIEIMMGPTRKKLARDLDWKADDLHGIAGRDAKLYSFKQSWEQAHAILEASYQYAMKHRTPYVGPAVADSPAPRPGDAGRTGSLGDYLRKANDALKKVDDVYYRLFTHNPRYVLSGDRPATFLYTDDVERIPLEIAAARRALNVLSTPDDDAMKAAPDADRTAAETVRDRLSAEAQTKLRKAMGLYSELVRGKKVQDRPEVTSEERRLIREARRTYAKRAGEVTDAIQAAQRLYAEFFDDNGQSKPAKLSALQISQYEGRIRRIGTQLDATIEEAERARISPAEQRAWDDLQARKSEAQGWLEAVAGRLKELKADKSEDGRVAAQAHEEFVGIRNGLQKVIQDIEQLHDEFFPSSTDLTPKFDSLSEEKIIAYHERAILLNRGLSIELQDKLHHRISEEDQKEWIDLQRRKVNAEGMLADVSGRLSILAEQNRRARTKPAESAGPGLTKSGTPGRPTETASPPESRAAVPSPAEASPKPAREVPAEARPEPAKPDAIALARARREAEARKAAEVKAGRDSAFRETDVLKQRRGEIETELLSLKPGEGGMSYADRLKKLDGFEEEIKPAMARLKELAAIVGPLADGVRNSFDALLRRRIPELRANIQKAEKRGALDAEVAGLATRADSLIREADSLLTGPVKPDDVPKLKDALDKLGVVDARLKAIFDANRDFDALRGRIVDHRGKIAEAAGRLQDRIQILLARAREDKEGRARKLNAEANTLIMQSERLRQNARRDARAGEQLRPILARLIAIKKDLEGIAGTLAEGHAVRETIMKFVGRVAKEIMEIEKITRSGALKPAEAAPLPGTPTTTGTPAPGDVRKEEKLPAVDYGNADLNKLDGDIQDIKKLALAIKNNDAREDDFNKRIAQMDALKERLDKAEKALGKYTDARHRMPVWQIREAVGYARSDIDHYIRTIRLDKEAESPEVKLGRLTSRMPPRAAAIQITGGVAITFSDNDSYKDGKERVYNALREIYTRTPFRAAVVQAAPANALANQVALDLGMGQKIPAQLASDVRVPGETITILLYHDSAGATAGYAKITGASGAKEAAEKHAAAEAEARRIAPFKGLERMARAGGGKAIEIREPKKPELYITKVRMRDVATTLQFIRKMAAALNLEEMDDFFVFAHPRIANALVNGSAPMNVRGSRVFELSAAGAGDVYIVTPSANKGFTIKNQFGEKEDQLKPYLHKMGLKPGAGFKRVISDTDKKHAAAQAATAKKAGIEIKLGPDQEIAGRASAPQPAPEAPVPSPPPVPAAQPTAPPTGPTATEAGPSPQYGPFVLPKVFRLKQLSVSDSRKYFGLAGDKTAIYTGYVSPQELARKARLMGRLQNIITHAKSLGMASMVIVYRGQTSASDNSFKTFSAIVKEANSGSGFNIRFELESFPMPIDNPEDEVSYILIKDVSVSVPDLLSHYRKYMKKVWDKVH